MKAQRALVAGSLVAATLVLSVEIQAIRRPPIHGDPPQGAPRAASTHTEVLGVSQDRATALVRVASLQDRNVLPRYRRVQIQGNRVIEEFALPARDALESAVFFGRLSRDDIPSATGTNAHRRDLARYREALGALVYNNDHRFASAPDRALFNIGDDLWIADRDGGNARKISTTPAAYGPLVSPDRQRVAFTAMIGRLDGVVGNYVLHLYDLQSRAAPVRVSTTRDVRFEDLRWSNDGRYVFARMGAEHPEGGCFVRVLARPPYTVERLACVDQQERADFVAYSPGIRVAVVHGFRVIRSGGAQHSVQWVDLSSGRVTHTARYVGVLSTGGVNDRGQLLCATSAMRAVLFDPATRAMRESAGSTEVPILFHDAAWLDDDRFVIGRDGGVQVVSLGQIPWVNRGWPGI